MESSQKKSLWDQKYLEIKNLQTWFCCLYVKLATVQGDSS